MIYKDFGCRVRGIPHDLVIKHESERVKWERCTLCGKKFRWNKRNKRIDNVEYLKAHVRNFAQRWGATKRVYHKVYKPETCKIKISI